MNIRKEDRPFVFAHRGASGYRPENTLESFALAIEMNADGIELDVQLTKDGQVVVIHDETINRTSDHQGRVMDYTLEELKTFDFNNHMEGVFRIPTLAEVLDLMKNTGMIINIELKNSVFFYPGMEQKVIDLVAERNMKDQIIYSSFNHVSLMKLREIDPDAYVGLLHSDNYIDMGKYGAAHKANALHPAFYLLQDPQYIKQCHENGLECNSYTINEVQYMKIARQMKVDGIFTNYPDVAISLYKGNN